MGLIKAALGAAGGVMADQWKEYFYSEALTSDMLMVKGKKKISGRSANVFGSDNIISNGSVPESLSMTRVASRRYLQEISARP